MTIHCAHKVQSLNGGANQFLSMDAKKGIAVNRANIIPVAREVIASRLAYKKNGAASSKKKGLAHTPFTPGSKHHMKRVARLERVAEVKRQKAALRLKAESGAAAALKAKKSPNAKATPKKSVLPKKAPAAKHSAVKKTAAKTATKAAKPAAKAAKPAAKKQAATKKAASKKDTEKVVKVSRTNKMGDDGVIRSIETVCTKRPLKAGEKTIPRSLIVSGSSKMHPSVRKLIEETNRTLGNSTIRNTDEYAIAEWEDYTSSGTSSGTSDAADYEKQVPKSLMGSIKNWWACK